MKTTEFDFPTLIPKFDAILSRGLCSGVGDRNGQMCIEAAICAVLDLPHGDNPSCVSTAVRNYKIALNDSNWSSPAARADGLRALGIAQIGSISINDAEFAKRLAEKTIRVLIPALFREIFTDAACLAAADRCEKEGTQEAARAAAEAAARAAGARAARAEAAAVAEFQANELERRMLELFA